MFSNLEANISVSEHKCVKLAVKPLICFNPRLSSQSMHISNAVLFIYSVMLCLCFFTTEGTHLFPNMFELLIDHLVAISSKKLVEIVSAQREMAEEERTSHDLSGTQYRVYESRLLFSLVSRWLA
jgi:hypothetical protein